MNQTIRYIFILLGVILLGFFLWYFKSIIAYILVSAVLLLIGRPVVDFLSMFRIKQYKLPRAFCAGFTLLLLWAVVFMFFRIFVPLVVNQANELSSIDVRQVAASLQEPIGKIVAFFEKYNISQRGVPFQDYLTNKVAAVLNISVVSNIFSSVASFMGDIFISIFSISFITFFFLKEERLFTDGILLITPSRYEDNIRRALHSCKNLLTRYFVGILIQVSCIIILITIGLSIIGLRLNTALVIGLVIGLLNVVPYIGPIIGGLFGLIIGIATNLGYDFYSQLLPLLVYMTLVFVLVHIIDNVVFQPLIYSNSVNAHPLEIFLVIMMAGSLAGVTGMILAIPSYTILRVFAKEFFYNFKVVKKITEKI